LRCRRTNVGTKPVKKTDREVNVLAIRGRLLCALVLSTLCAGAAHAEDPALYPSRPIRVIVPVGPGAGLDHAARITAEAVEKHIGQRLVLENKPGAGQRIATALAAKAAPDGYTLLFTTPTPIAVAPHFYSKLDYDPVRDFDPVSLAVYQPVMLIVRPGLGVKSVAEFVSHAKHNPGKVSFGVQGLGGEMHFLLELMKKRADINVNVIPYNAAAQAIIDLLADRLDAMFLVIPPIKAHVDNGRLLALATLNDKRVATFPAVPTMAEAGLPAVRAAIWFGYLAPAGTPRAVINRLAAAFRELQSDAALIKRAAGLGAELTIVGPADFGRIIEEDRSRYGKIAAESNFSKLN
jgi:tripartite-type tricarboxylate transporter receptor subunit TctC